MQSFQDLMERILNGDTTVNFTDLRWAFTATSAYAPLGGPADKIEMEMRNAIEEEDAERAIALAVEALRYNPLNIRTHCYLWNLFNLKNKPDQADFHGWFGRKLLESIETSGDGRTMETAIAVISVEEEHNFLNFKGLRADGPFTLYEGPQERMYDGVPVTNLERGESFSLYFDVSCSINYSKLLLGDLGKKQ